LVEYVADPGTCWMGDLTILDYLMREVKQAGGTAIKPQFWPKRLYKGHELEQEAMLCRLDEVVIEHIVKMAKKHQLDLWFSVFGLNEFAILEQVFPEACKTVKIAESQSRNQKLLDRVMRSEPVERVIVSVASTHDRERLLRWLPLGREAEVLCLYCCPKYPAEYKDVRFPRRRKGEGTFPDQWFGFSDHTRDGLAAAAAVAKGAQMIEKHVRPIPITYMSLIGRPPQRYPDDVCDVSSHAFGVMVEQCEEIRRMVEWS